MACLIIFIRDRYNCHRLRNSEARRIGEEVFDHHHRLHLPAVLLVRVSQSKLCAASLHNERRVRRVKRRVRRVRHEY